MPADQPITLDERKAECRPLVLVVDDDALHHKLLELLADQLRITCHMASSCGQAIEALRMFSFDVILMDYRMPEVDGCMCTHQIRAIKELCHIPIIAVTGNVLPGMEERCREAGMDDYLEKPFTLEGLHTKLCYWLNKKEERKDK